MWEKDIPLFTGLLFLCIVTCTAAAAVPAFLLHRDPLWSLLYGDQNVMAAWLFILGPPTLASLLFGVILMLHAIFERLQMDHA